MSRLETNWSVTYTDPNFTITYASVYDAEIKVAASTIITADVRNSDLIQFGNTTLKFSKCTAPSEANRADLITAIAALNTGGGGGGASLAANEYAPTNAAELTTAVSDATTAAVPYRIKLPPGTFAYTSGTLTFPANGTIEGSGMDITILTATQELAAGAFKFEPNCFIKDLTFSNLDNGDTVNFYGFVVPDNGCTFDSVKFKEFDATAVYYDAVYTATKFFRCQFVDPHTSSSTTGIYCPPVSAASEVYIDKCLFSDMAYGFYSEGIGPNNKVTNSRFENISINQVFVSNSKSVSAVNYFEGNYFSGAGDLSLCDGTGFTVIPGYKFDYINNDDDDVSGTITRFAQPGDSIVQQHTGSDINWNGTTTVIIESIGLTPGVWNLHASCWVRTYVSGGTQNGFYIDTSFTDNDTTSTPIATAVAGTMHFSTHRTYSIDVEVEVTDSLKAFYLKAFGTSGSSTVTMVDVSYIGLTVDPDSVPTMVGTFKRNLNF